NDTTPIGSYPIGASPYGALDMTGNVWEWVSDWSAIDYYSISPYENPEGPNDGFYRVMRGGSAADVSSTVPTYFRSTLNGIRYHLVGFRCATSSQS
ncbi:MAG: SUMF1/EgtB/PvdO family nonheme iron enzyme, partial [Chloroflexi bacterium]|nr:SUMF1/EgtB/PvdO family nonheme iron enzyme [Chloroflexota bacterium]